MIAERKPHVVVVVLNHNGLADTIECYRSLRGQDYTELTVLIVDNGSTEPGTENLLEACPEAHVIRLDWNHGFAGGSNVGMEWALRHGADYVWLLNNDTVARPDAVSVLVQAAQGHPEFAFFGNLIGLYDEPDTIWFAGGELNLLTGRFQHRGMGDPVGELARGGVEATPVLTGCSLLVSADTIRSLGVLDPHYFIYWEEVDWQLRARRTGRRSALVRELLVHHKVSRTTTRNGDIMRPLLMARNCLLVARTHAGKARPIWVVNALLSMVVRPLLRGNIQQARAAFAGLWQTDVPPERLFASARKA